MTRRTGVRANTLEIAFDYVARGWSPIPVAYQTKKPIPKNWPELRVTSETAERYFNRERLNIGVLLGQASNGLVDMDLDCMEALLLAPYILPATCCFGRKSKPRSHWLYQCLPPPLTEQFVADDNSMLLELRSTGTQTVFPGSVHEAGEGIAWHASIPANPVSIEAEDLVFTVRKLAAGALLLRAWNRGSRDEIATALVGALLRDGWRENEVDQLIEAVCNAAGDEEGPSRLKSTRLAQALDGGSGPVPGWPRLATLVGEPKAQKLRAWLAKKPANRNSAQTEQLSDVMAELNSDYAVVPVGGSVRILYETVDPKTGWRTHRFYTRADFNMYFFNRKVPGNPKQSISDYWLAHPNRRQYRGLIFEPSPPGKEKEIPGYYNLWQGFPVAPAPNDWSLYRSHVLQIICNGDEELFQYVISWMADAIQHPAQKPGVAIVLRGRQGTGKGKMVEWYGKLFGPHFIQVTSPHHLLGHFNAHLEDKLLLFADEAFWAGDRASEGKLKGMITEQHQMVERKGVDAIFVQNYLRLIAASNHDWVIPAALEERRFLVLDVSDSKMQDHAYFEAIDKQMTNGGLEGLIHHLLSLDLSTVNLRAVPQTAALLEQKVQSMGAVDKWWFQVLRAGAIKEAEDEWPYTPIATGELYDLFHEYAKANGQRYVQDLSSFSMRLRKIIPGLQHKRVTNPQSKARFRSYVIPSLDDCRRAFEIMLRIKIEWPDGSAALREGEF